MKNKLLLILFIAILPIHSIFAMTSEQEQKTLHEIKSIVAIINANRQMYNPDESIPLENIRLLNQALHLIYKSFPEEKRNEMIAAVDNQFPIEVAQYNQLRATRSSDSSSTSADSSDSSRDTFIPRRRKITPNTEFLPIIHKAQTGPDRTVTNSEQLRLPPITEAGKNNDYSCR
ncbi:MAG: hypothetical protein JO129_01620 [Candidatus Dependentiae bacterium]|nr:hypothetical protein [Candidatus Dependentiae bacterium]